MNIFTFDEEHFEQQSINIKKIFYAFQARKIALDANGLGIGLVDYLIKGQTDIDGTYYPPFGVDNDEDGFYKKYKTDDMEKGALYLIKANAPMNTEIYTYVQSQLLSGKIKFLVNENEAKLKLLSTKYGQSLDSSQREDYLKPYILTSILRKQMLNLIEETQGINIILKRNNTSIPKDKFSAFSYGLHWIKIEEDKLKRRKGRNLSKMMCFTSTK